MKKAILAGLLLATSPCLAQDMVEMQVGDVVEVKCVAESESKLAAELRKAKQTIKELKEKVAKLTPPVDRKLDAFRELNGL